ncbi:hypothetical protein [Pectinatus haikarae]|uniref:Methyl-accepting chemotaxis protein n=1 Tax=Pectinatus haikarae TaxID=349096 RepID=A0ABT9Y6Q6_9FIRM|nr:hypothetical protein [Pectinatus haikarae]MDQ0203220.1 hypothetical protein [Pectinatus haikarae]
MKGITKSIKTLFIIGTVGMVILVSGIQSAYSIYQFKQNMESEVQNNLRYQSGEITNSLSIPLAATAKYAELLSYNVSTMSHIDTDLLLNTMNKYISSEVLLLAVVFGLSQIYISRV